MDNQIKVIEARTSYPFVPWHLANVTQVCHGLIVASVQSLSCRHVLNYAKYLGKCQTLADSLIMKRDQHCLQLTGIHNEIVLISLTHLKGPEHSIANDVPSCVLKLLVPSQLNNAIEQVSCQPNAPKADEHGDHQLSTLVGLRKT